MLDEFGKKQTAPLWFSIIFDFHKTKTLKKLSFSVIAVGLYTLIIEILEDKVFHIDFKAPSIVFSILGIVLGLLLVFRTNTAYDRWWEGRKLLSSLGSNAKNFAIKINSYLPLNDIPNKIFFAKMISNHAFAMKENLRGEVQFEELDEVTPGYNDLLKSVYHVPNQIVSSMTERIVALYKEGKITDPQLLELSKHMDAAVEIVASCERIRTTPVPFSYSIHLKKFIFFFTVILPFGFIHDLGYWCFIIVMIIFYALVGLEAIGEEIEDPFGQDENDLPIDAICRSLKKSVNAILKVQ
jgi:putative membrane protein